MVSRHQTLTALIRVFEEAASPARDVPSSEQQWRLSELSGWTQQKCCWQGPFEMMRLGFSRRILQYSDSRDLSPTEIVIWRPELT